MQYTQKRMPTIILQNAEYTNLLEVTPITLVINTKYYEVDAATIVLPYDQWLTAVNIFAGRVPTFFILVRIRLFFFD